MQNNRADDRLLWLRWLTRLRWVALIAQVITLGFAYPLLAPYWVFFVLIGLLGLLLAANLRAVAVTQSRETVPELTLLWQLGLDVVALSVFFLLGGGPENPFVVLYMVHVAMGAIMLEARQATVLSLFVLASYLTLHVWHLPLHYENHSLSRWTLHRVGQVIAFMVTVPSVSIFIVGVATALRRRTRLLLEARDRTSRTDRLRMVGTVAAGAAHELNTPLSTIGLRARRIARRHKDDDTLADIEVLQSQLARCTRIVQQLLAGAGDPTAAGFERAPLAQLVSESVKLWTTGSNLRVDIEDRSDGAMVNLPSVAFSQALTNLLENARQAQDANGSSEVLRIELYRDDDNVFVALRDHGCGLPESDADEVGTPFFTTKTHGTGLGVFVARQVADGAGGGLRYVKHSDGTTALWWFPLDRPATPRRAATPEEE